MSIGPPIKSKYPTSNADDFEARRIHPTEKLALGLSKLCAARRALQEATRFLEKPYAGNLMEASNAPIKQAMASLIDAIKSQEGI